MEFTEKERTRYWAKVKQGRASECWPWAAAVAGDGYGRVRIGGKLQLAHRVAYLLRYGIIPEVDGRPTNVRPSCGNPLCCNWRHLTTGMRGDHKAEQHRLAAQPPRVPSRQEKLSDTEVRTMRELYARNQATQKELAERYKLTQVRVGELVRGEGRKEAGGPITRRGRGRRVMASTMAP